MRHVLASPAGSTPRSATSPPSPGFQALHAYFLDRLVAACASLLAAAVQEGEIRWDVDVLTLMHGAGNLCIGVDAGSDTGYDAHRMVGLLIAGLRQSPSA